MLPITGIRPRSPGPADDRPAFLMSHSFGFARREWIEVSKLLAEEYRTIAIDMPGFGAANEVKGYSMEQVTRQFAEVIVGLGLERYVLVGHSVTGKVMQILASRMGTELGLKTPPEKLLLVTPTPLGKKVGGEEMRTMLLAAQNNRWGAEKFVATHSGLSLSSTVKERTMPDSMKANARVCQSEVESASGGIGVVL